MTPRTKPTFKQAQFAREYVKRGGKGTEAAMTVYDTTSRGAAKSIGYQNLQKPVVQQEIKRILTKAGLSPENATDFLKKAIESGLGEKATNSDALRGIDMVLKLHNAYPANKTVKLSYSKQEQVMSKDFQKLQDDLQQLNEATQRLLSSTK